MTMKEQKPVETNLADLLASLEVDVTGIASIENIAGTKLEKSARNLLPEVNSIIVLGMEIDPEFLDLSIPERTTGAPRMKDIMEKHKEFLRGQLAGATYKIMSVSHSKNPSVIPTVSRKKSVQ